MGKRKRFRDVWTKDARQKFTGRPFRPFRGRPHDRSDPLSSLNTSGTAAASRKRRYHGLIESETKRPRLDPRISTEDDNAKGSMATNISSCIHNLLAVAKNGDEGQFVNECHVKFKEVFCLSQRFSKHQFDDILEKSRIADIEKNKSIVARIIEDLPVTDDIVRSDLANFQFDLRQAISSGHLMTEEHFMKLLRFLADVRHFSSSLFCQILQDTKFFNSAGVLSNIVHLLRKYKDDKSKLMDFFDDITLVLSTFASSRKSSEESIASCLQLIEDSLLRLPDIERERFIRRRDAIRMTISKNKHRLQDLEELQVIASYPILPSTEVIKENRGPIIPLRQKDIPFESEIQYLSHYFNTFVEDFIGPMRNGINRYIQYVNDPKQKYRFRDNDVRLYKRIKISKEKYLPEAGKVFEIQFDVSSFKRLRWDTCDFLKYGNLVCLTYNDCPQIVYGLVAERNVPDLRSGRTLIKIVSNDQIMASMLRSETQLVMIESKAFFTAYHHTLEELQNMAERMIHDRNEVIPFAENLAFLQDEVLPPLYIHTKDGSSKKLNFSCMLRYGLHNEGALSDSQPYLSLRDDLRFLPLTCLANEPLNKIPASRNDISSSPGYRTTSPNYNDLSPSELPGSRLYKPVSSSNESSSPSNSHTSFANTKFHLSSSSPVDDVGNPCAVKKETSEEVPVMLFDLWPSCEKLGLDLSQYAAFRHAITSSLAVIQGPPGTGKTLLGQRIAEFMLNNFDRIHEEEKKPILLLSYTNHALDQFMEEILKTKSIRNLFTGSRLPFLRIGARCDNELVKGSTLFEHKRRRSMFHAKDIRRDLMQLSESINNATEAKRRMQYEVIDEEYLITEGIIPVHLQHHFYDSSSSKYETVLLQFLDVFNRRSFQFCRQNVCDNHSNQNQTRSGSDKGTFEEVDKELYHELITQRMLWDDDDHETCDTFAKDVKFAIFVDQRCREKNISRRDLDENIRFKLSQTIPATNVDETNLLDPWSLLTDDRWQLYKLWMMRTEGHLNMQIDRNIKMFNERNERFKDIQKRETFQIMKDCRLVAMTTTGAAKHMDILRRVAPRIIIVEEAAQVNEQHILGCLQKDAQHMILIGDHQQLKPTVNNYNLAMQHRTDMSMMERLAINGIPFQRLNEQHRMIPVISDLLRSTIYEDLLDHESVLEYEPIRGIAQNVILFDHNEKETQQSEFSTSYRNEYEAGMIAGLYRYLRLQGYRSRDITILSAYNEQVRCIRKIINPIDNDLARRENSGINQNLREARWQLDSEIPHNERSAPQKRQGVRVTAVDNFQGEENKIILLSLVRSNNEGRIGHLRDEKRICVSLSRAKLGFFALGNFSMLQKKSKHWEKIIKKANDANLVKEHFTLVCQNHPDKEIRISRPEDYNDLVPEGGCSQPCETQLKCGHMCPMTCHADIFVHNLPCTKECTRKCRNGHKCKRQCSEPCGYCHVMIEKTIPSCGHSAQMHCSKDPSDFKCKERCENIISCQYNHKCQKSCGAVCNTQNDCMELVKVKDKCGHEYQTPCCMSQKLCCTVPCGEILPCGHTCKGTCGKCSCGRLHVPCNQTCARVLVCGHTCNAKHQCTNNCPPCKKKCNFGCSHRPKQGCQKLCGDKCIPCKERCDWRCSSKCKNKFWCTKYCYDLCDRKRCDQPCKKRIQKCKHPCIGLCGEPCPSLCWTCDRDILTEIFFGTEDEPGARFVQLADCGHVLEVTGLDTYIDGMVSNEQISGENSTVASREINFISCPRCKAPIKRSFRYGNIIKSIKQDIEMVKTAMIDFKGRKVNVSNEYDQLLGSVGRCSIDDGLIQTLSHLRNLGTGKLNINYMYVRTLKQLLDQLDKHALKLYAAMIKDNTSKSAMQQIMRLAKWISEKRNMFSQFELEQFSMELKRLQLLILFYIIQQDAKRCNRSIVHEKEKIVSTIENLENPKRNVMEELNTLDDLYTKLRKVIHRNGLGISDSEKIGILKAIGLTKGHWYKCPNGHVYCIGECGGAMEKAKCPECGENIGGERHALTAGNRVATEMDGATFAAWSEEANNMGNYEDFL